MIIRYHRVSYHARSDEAKQNVKSNHVGYVDANAASDWDILPKSLHSVEQLDLPSYPTEVG